MMPSPPRRLGAKGFAALLIVLAIAAVAALFVLPVQAHKDGHLPPEGCDCHSEQPSPAVTVLVDGWPKEFTPDTTYHLKVSATGDVPGNAGGFSMEVSKGHLESSDPAVATFGKDATHADSGQRSWAIDWIAPPEDSGSTHLIVYVNLANGDGREGEEDHWNVLELNAPEKAPEPPKPSGLVLSFTGENGTLTAGHNMTILALLTNFTGTPIPKARVTVFQNTSYGALTVGQNLTDAKGQAAINWTVLAPCDCRFFAHYDGSSKNLSVNATGVVTITDPDGVYDTLYPSPSTHVFSSYVGVTTSIGVVVIGVWITLGYAAFAVIRMRSQSITGNQRESERK